MEITFTESEPTPPPPPPTPQTSTPFQKAVAILEGNGPLEIPIELLSNPEDIISFILSELSDIVAGTGLYPIEVKQWEAIFGGDDEFYLMNLYGDGVENYKLHVIFTDSNMTPFQKAVAILEGITFEIPDLLLGEPVSIIAFLQSEIADIVLGTGLYSIEVLQWTIEAGGDGCFYLMDPDTSANNNYKINVNGF